MSFVNPWFLMALASISIPIIIHLYSFRRFRKVLFSNISFLSELKEEKKKQSKLKNLLVLLARILAVIFLVLAFARPYIPYEGAEISHEGNIISVYIDNSFSMEALSGRGRLIDEAKHIAGEIAGAFSAADKFHLVTNDFEGRHQRFVSSEDFMSLLREVEISPVVRKISQVYQRQENMMSSMAYISKNVFMISDFQKIISDLENLEPDTAISVYFVPVRAQQADNVYIDSLWFESPVKQVGRPVNINVSITNGGLQSLENQPLRLYVDDVLRSVSSFDIKPGETLNMQVSYKINETGIQQGRVEIIDHPVVFDDKMYFSFNVIENIPVLVVNQDSESRYLNALFRDEETFSLRNMSLLNIDYSAFHQSHTIILNGLNSISSGLRLELVNFLEEGGSMIIFPGKNIDFDSYREFLELLGVNYYESYDTTTYRVSSINDMHYIYRDVFDDLPDGAELPIAKNHYKISRSVRGTEDYLLQLQNGNNFFTSQPLGNGNIYLSAVPLTEEYSDFPVHPVFVPTLFNAALFSVPFQKPYHMIGDRKAFQLRHRQTTREPIFYIKGEGIEVIPEARIMTNRIDLYTHGQINNAGNYLLYNNDNIIEGMSFNYDRRESQLDVYDANKLNDILKDHQIRQINTLEIGDTSFEKAFERLAMGRELWQLCLILALVFFLVEILLLRFWRSK